MWAVSYTHLVWQVELLKRVVAEGWPATIAMPTSSGKTSAIDVAIFHLALDAGKGAFERRSSLRTFLIVDRRVVVDEAFDHAEKIANGLLESSDDAVKEVAEGLKRFGGEVPLQAVSYTHLDVYKRQQRFCRSRNSGSSGSP